jgi:secreted trypsin-like serine protease
LVGLSTGATNWCSVGAFTRIARYVDWIKTSVEYLESNPEQQQREQHAEETTNKTGKNRVILSRSYYHVNIICKKDMMAIISFP